MMTGLMKTFFEVKLRNMLLDTPVGKLICMFRPTNARQSMKATELPYAGTE
jgi:hypothetical protein